MHTYTGIKAQKFGSIITYTVSQYCMILSASVSANIAADMSQSPVALPYAAPAQTYPKLPCKPYSNPLFPLNSRLAIILPVIET